MPGCEELLQGPAVVLIYGEAGAGKTTLALQLLRGACYTRCLYVSTERLDFLRRAEQIGVDLSRLIVVEAFDSTDFLDVVTRRDLHMNDAIAVDSINAYARLGEDHAKLTMLLAAALKHLSSSYGVHVIETAQVHWTDDGEEPVLAEPLELWADIVVEIRRAGPGGERRLFIRGRGGLLAVAEAKITGVGMEWLRCSTP